MSLRNRQGRHYESVHIDVVPMVDCMLVLVIFLMVSSVFVAAPGVEVERPDVSGGETAEHNFLLLAITADDRMPPGTAAFASRGEVAAFRIGTDPQPAPVLAAGCPHRPRSGAWCKTCEAVKP